MSGHNAIVELAHSLESQVLHGSADPAALSGILFGGVDRVRTIVSRLRQAEADRSSKTETSPEAADYLLFTVGSRPMLIPLSDLVRVERPASVAPVPFTPAFVLGLTQLGGETMPLLELAPRLEMPTAGTFPPWALVVGPAGERIALGVEGVAEIRSVWHGQLSPVPGAREETPDAAILEDAGQIPVLHVQKILNRPIQEDFVVLSNES
jgi:chemotaxis signal transduction protein